MATFILEISGIVITYTLFDRPIASRKKLLKFLKRIGW